VSVQLVQKPEVRPILEILAGLPQVLGCIKDVDGVYRYVNAGFADRLGLRPDQIVGHSVQDHFPPEFAASYAAQDEQVLRTGRPLQHHLELIVRSDGRIGWYVTSKARILDATGVALGIVVVSVDLRAQLESSHAGLARAVDALRADVGRPWRVAELADLADLSEKQFQRLARRSLGLSPQQLIQRLRIEHAVRLMTTTPVSLGQISAECGFYDQSSFTRQFTRLLGLTPGAYRRTN
jgi:PAS domain S-box-containing protein